MWKVFVADELGREGVALLEARPGFDVVVETGLDEASLCERIGDFDALLVRSATRVSARVLEAARRLKVVGRAGIGVDNIDLDAATERGVLVLNTPDANATTTAELAIAHMLSLARRLPAADRSVRAGEWKRSAFMGTQLAGKTAGVVGFGTIGRLVAARCRALGMQVLVHDPYVTAKAVEEARAKAVDLDTLLAEADFVTLHVPKTKETANLLDAARLGRMKRGARLVNCARGGLVDEAALAEALRAGQLAGAALDVFATEPPAGSPLLELDEVTLTPHIGASTKEAQSAVSEEIARGVMAFLETGRLVHPVNLRARGDFGEAGRTHGLLARRLGALAGALAGFTVARLEVGLFGRAAELRGSSVATEALVGLLAPRREAARVNLVNAAHEARRAGLALEEKVSESPLDDHEGLVSVVARGAEGEKLAVSGALFSGRFPRLVAIDDARLEAVLEGNLLVTRHEDKPGVVGEVGTLLGKAGVNITRMHVGVPEGEAAGEAWALLAIARPLEREEQAAIASCGPIRHVSQVALEI